MWPPQGIVISNNNCTRQYQQKQRGNQSPGDVLITEESNLSQVAFVCYRNWKCGYYDHNFKCQYFVIGLLWSSQFLPSHYFGDPFSVIISCRVLSCAFFQFISIYYSKTTSLNLYLRDYRLFWTSLPSSFTSSQYPPHLTPGNCFSIPPFEWSLIQSVHPWPLFHLSFVLS